jgi:hypothetical protein
MSPWQASLSILRVELLAHLVAHQTLADLHRGPRLLQGLLAPLGEQHCVQTAHHRSGNFYIADESLPRFLFASPRGPATSRLKLQEIFVRGRWHDSCIPKVRAAGRAARAAFQIWILDKEANER